MKTNRNKYYSLVLFLFFISNNIYCQSCYSYKYKLEPYRIPDTFTVSYTIKNVCDNKKADSIMLVVLDTFLFENGCYIGLHYPDKKVFVSVWDSSMIEYSSSFEIRLLELFPPQKFFIKDTGTTHIISKITIIKGTHSHGKVKYIHSKIPLSEETINAIREYVFKKAPEPPCIKDKKCYIYTSPLIDI